MRIFATLFSILLLCSACTGSNEFGECIGLNAEKDPALTYESSFRNAFWSLVFSETLVVPVLWWTDYAYCPTGVKAN